MNITGTKQYRIQGVARMGGQGWDFEFDLRDRPALEAMRRTGARRARTLGLSWRSSVKGNVCDVAVDGGWWAIDLLISRLARDLPIICEAVELSHRSPLRRAGLGRSFAHIAAQSRFSEGDFHADGWRPVLVAMEGQPWETTVFGFSAPNAPDLEARLDVTARMLVEWEFQEIAPEVMLEELHTAVELTLKRVLWGRYRRQGTIADMVEKAEQLGLLRLPVVSVNRWSLRAIEHAESKTVSELILSLKDARNPVRHQGRDLAEQWLVMWSLAIGEVLEVLAGRSWTLGGPGDPATGIDNRRSGGTGA